MCGEPYRYAGYGELLHDDESQDWHAPTSADPGTVWPSAAFKSGWEACLQALKDQLGEDYTTSNPNPRWHLQFTGYPPASAEKSADDDFVWVDDDGNEVMRLPAE